MEKRIRRWLNVIRVQTMLVGLALILGGCQAGDDPDLAAASAAEPIFNGEDLTGWNGDSRFWSVEDGSIVGETTEDTPTETNTFLIWEGGEPADFELTFDYRFIIVTDDSSGNSGIQIRSERFEDEEFPDLEHRVRGYQADMAISDWIPGIHYEEGGRGVLARRGQRVLIDAEGERQEERFAEEADLGEYVHLYTEWNDYRVYAHGDTIRAWINDQLTHEVIDESPEARREGILAFQLHRGPPMRVELRDITLKRLYGASAEAP